MRCDMKVYQVELLLTDKRFIGYFEAINKRQLIKYLPDLYERLEIENNSIKKVLIREVKDYWYD